MPQGARAAFDRKTHRRVVLRTTRLTYIYAAAHLLENRETEEITQDVLAHLEQAQAVMQRAWGAAEWTRLGSSTIDELDQITQSALLNALGAEAYQSALTQTLSSLSPEDREQAIDALGRRALTEIYRQLLLSVITELWVDYLTQMEALRVSIGLEAYGQRDPLVQYKSRAFALFQELLGNMRLGVVSRMFTYRPRDLTTVQAQTAASRAEMAELVEIVETPDGNGSEEAEYGEEEDMELTEPESETPAAQAGAAAYAVKTSQAAPAAAAAASTSGSQGKGKKRRRRRH